MNTSTTSFRPVPAEATPAPAEPGRPRRQRPTLTTLLDGLGRNSAAHPWRTIAAWAAVLAVALGLAVAVGGSPHDNYDVPGTRSQAGTALLRAQFPQMAGAADRVVVHDRAGNPLGQDDLAALGERLAAMPHVDSVAPPRVSADGTTALLDVQYDVPVTDPDLNGNLTPLQDAVASARAAGLQVELTGEVPENTSAPLTGVGELAGILVALVLLVLAFGSVLAAGMPIVVALVGLAVGSGGVLLLAAVMDVSVTAPTVATMVGLGVGIDYALFLVTRHVEYLRAGHSVPAAAGLATSTAGRSVVFAGATVLASLMGLRLSGLSTYASFGFATAIVVLSVMATALTLVPALLGLAGRRVLPRRERKHSYDAAHRAAPAATVTLTARWAQRVGRRPVPWIVVSVALLLTLAVPVLDLQMWPTDTGAQPTDLTTRRGFDLVASEFGPGANGPFVVAVDLTAVPQGSLESLRSELSSYPGVAGVSPAVVSPSGQAAVLSVEPSTAPSDERTSALVDRLRADVLPAGAELTGLTPVFKDINDLLAQRIWLVIGFVVLLSFMLLTVVFRSLVVPLKAAVMNLLSIGAAYGVVVAVFQWGWGVSLLGIDHPVPVSSWVPILMFAVAFGLSMDYEVFLLGRIREDWLRTGDARGSVVSGLASTGRLISIAAAIMVAVFIGFASEGDVILKQVGVGMAAAILIDATLVRLVLVPATMAVLGRANWWLPAWLDRWLPHLDVEAHSPASAR